MTIKSIERSEKASWITPQQMLERCIKPNPEIMAALIGTQQEPGALPVQAVASIVAQYALDNLNPNLTNWYTALDRLNMLPRKVPSLSIEQILESNCPTREGQVKEDGTYYKVSDTSFLYLRPRGTLNEFVARAGAYGEIHLKEYGGKNPFGFSYFWNKKPSSVNFEEPQWVLLSKGLLDKSCNKTYLAQIQMIEEISKKTFVNYEIPTLFEVVTTVFLHKLVTGESILPAVEMEPVYTRVQNTFQDCHLIVGGFASNGLVVYIADKTCREDGIGIMVSRKF